MTTFWGVWGSCSPDWDTNVSRKCTEAREGSGIRSPGDHMKVIVEVVAARRRRR